MHFPKKYSKFIKYATLATLTSSAGWIFYQVKKTKDILNNAIDTSILQLQEKLELQSAEHNKFIVVDFDDEPWSIQSVWTSFLFSYAKRLIVLASNENQFIRKRAVLQLSRIKQLDYWHFNELAQLIDARTAIGLARCIHTDHRIFPDVPVTYMGHSQCQLTEHMQQLLIKLYEKKPHSCLGYFISKFFSDQQDDVGRFADADSHSFAYSLYIQSTHDVLPLCLEALLHHASQGDNAQDIVKLNGLPLLLELYTRYQDKPEIVATICRIVSYISIHSHLRDDFFKTGWISVLAKWLHNDDVRINIPAAKALANLDPDESSLYLQRLYLLHPQNRINSAIKADVIFVHGLLGGVFFTWRQRNRNSDVLGLLGKKVRKASITPEEIPVQKKARIDVQMQDFVGDVDEDSDYTKPFRKYQIILEDLPTNTNEGAEGPYSFPGSKFSQYNDGTYTYCWPKDWLPKDCTHALRIVGVNYESSLSMWMPVCPNECEKTLDDRSDELLEQLLRIGVGSRPIIWVAHSMGGLMVKNIINKANRSDNPKVRQLGRNSKGVIFYSTPHFGSSLAKFSQASAMVIWPTIEVQELELDSPKLIDIHNGFLNSLKHNPMKIVTFVETQPTIISALKFRFLIVEANSGNPKVGDYYEIPLDHLGICKPACRRSFLYQKVLHVIETVISETSPDIDSSA